MEQSTENNNNAGLGFSWFEIALWKRILAAMVVGVVVGALWGEGAASIGWLGDLFIRLIRMIVVPLVFVTISSRRLPLWERPRGSTCVEF